MQAAPEERHVEKSVRRYITQICRATRTDSRVNTGVSPRATQRLFEASRATAAMNGRQYVTPEDVKRVARPVLAHRLQLTADARVGSVEKRSVVDDILDETEVPSVNTAGGASGNAQQRNAGD